MLSEAAAAARCDLARDRRALVRGGAAARARTPTPAGGSTCAPATRWRSPPPGRCRRAATSSSRCSRCCRTGMVGLRRELVVACAGLEKILDRPDQARRRLLAARPGGARRAGARARRAGRLLRRPGGHAPVGGARPRARHGRRAAGRGGCGRGVGRADGRRRPRGRRRGSTRRSPGSPRWTTARSPAGSTSTANVGDRRADGRALRGRRGERRARPRGRARHGPGPAHGDAGARSPPSPTPSGSTCPRRSSRSRTPPRARACRASRSPARSWPGRRLGVHELSGEFAEADQAAEELAHARPQPQPRHAPRGDLAAHARRRARPGALPRRVARPRRPAARARRRDHPLPGRADAGALRDRARPRSTRPRSGRSVPRRARGASRGARGDARPRRPRRGAARARRGRAGRGGRARRGRGRRAGGRTARRGRRAAARRAARWPPRATPRSPRPSCARPPTTPAAAARSPSSATPPASCAASAPASPAPTRPPTAPGELTGRERDVADLVVQGRSNKQVAADLFLSEKTVEGTLTRVYAKLGVRSRVDLVRRLNPT